MRNQVILQAQSLEQNVKLTYNKHVPFKLDVLVDAQSKNQSNESIVPAWDEHDWQAEDHTEQRYGPA